MKNLSFIAIARYRNWHSAENQKPSFLSKNLHVSSICEGSSGENTRPLLADLRSNLSDLLNSFFIGFIPLIQMDLELNSKIQMEDNTLKINIIKIKSTSL